MPINKSALKRERQNIVRRSRNRILKSKVRTAYNRLLEAIHSKKKEDVDEKFSAYMSDLDKAVKKNIYHRNNGARKKSRIAKIINNAFKVEKSA